MVLITLPYFSLDTNVAFLRIKQWVFRQQSNGVSTTWIIAFFIHVFTSVLVLIAGFTQFTKNLIGTKTHRLMGAIYIIIILLLTGPSGFIMAILANGGIFSVISFTVLAILWWYFTYRAYTAIRKRDFESHAKFMYRSYALTLSAITLRLWKFIIVNFIYEMPPMDLYRIVAWLGWVPNLLFAEFLIYRGKGLLATFRKSKEVKKK